MRLVGSGRRNALLSASPAAPRAAPARIIVTGSRRRRCRGARRHRTPDRRRAARVRHRTRHRRIDGRHAIARMVDVGEIGREGPDVRVRKRSKTVHDGRHRPRRAAMQDARRPCAGSCKLLSRPRRGSGIGGGQRRRDPVVDHRAGVGVARLFRAEQIARRMARAAMAQPTPRGRRRDSIRRSCWRSGSKRPAGRTASSIPPAGSGC